MKVGELVLTSMAVFMAAAFVTNMVFDGFETVDANSGPRNIHKYYFEMVPDLDCIYIRTDWTGELGLTCNWVKFNRLKTNKSYNKDIIKEL